MVSVVANGRARDRRGSAVTLALLLVLALVPTGASAQSSGGHDLRSKVAAQADPRPDVVFRGRGWGHSTGLSQYGAYAMAREGRSPAQILSHYYPTTSLGTAEEDQRITVTIDPPSPQHQPVTAITHPILWRTCASATECTTVEQPAGQTWTLRTVADRPGRIQLRDADNGIRFNATGGTVWTQLTDRDRFEQARGLLTVGGNCGTGAPARCYAYGRFTFSVATSQNTDRLVLRNELPMEAYLRGIAEVPSGWGNDGGQGALQAQAIIARSYVLGRGRTTCATPACQVFAGYGKELAFAGGNWVSAVRGTRGQIVRDARGAIANTYYSSSHGGRSEASEDSWAYGGVVDYLRSVDDPWSLDARNPLRNWTAKVRNADLSRVTGTGSTITRIEVVSRTRGGTPSVLRLHGVDGRQVEFSTTPESQRTRSCNRRHAGNSLRCDLPAEIRRADGQLFTAAGGRFPSSQVRSYGFEPFTDDDGSVHEYAIVFAHQAGIAGGTSETTYSPRRAVTRGQMARFLFQTFALPRVEEHDFSDVPSDHTHATQIASVAAAGIALGQPDGTYRPNDPVSREQMATFLVRAMGLTPRASNFSDVSGVHARNVGAVAHAQITGGCEPERYCPLDPVTRDQMATFLHRAVRYLR